MKRCPSGAIKMRTRHAHGRDETVSVGFGPPLEVLGLAPDGHGPTFRAYRLIGDGASFSAVALFSLFLFW